MSQLIRAKKKAWKLCSEYIRLKYSDKNGNTRCFTCGKEGHYKEMQAGHFVAGRTNSILFDERGIRVQCRSCNVFRYGEALKFLIQLEKEMGINEARKLRDALIVLKNRPKRMFLSDYEELIEEYKHKIKKLKT